MYARLHVKMGSVPGGSVLRAECVTGTYFRVLGLAPVVGRGFSDDQTATDGTCR